MRASRPTGPSPAATSLESPTIATRRLEWALFAAGVAAFAALYVVLYPPTYSIVDEQGYLSYALVLARGTLHPDVADAFVIRVREYAATGHLAPSFGIGTSALLAPWVGISWKLGFAIIAALHLLGTALCVWALRKLELPVVWALLYLFHPVALLYSRTFMSDIPAMALTMGAVAAWLGPRRRPLLAGLLIGASLEFRFAQLASGAALGIAIFARELAAVWKGDAMRRLWPSFRGSALYGVGLLPGGALLILLNLKLYGVWLPEAGDGFALANVPESLPRYLLSLNCFFPLTLAVALFYPSRLRLECVLSAVATLLLYSAFFHQYSGFGSIGQMLVGDRFFLPLMALMLLPYAQALEALRARLGRFGNRALVAGTLGLVAQGGAIAWTHQQRLLQQSAVQSWIYEYTNDGAVVICESLSSFEYFMDALGPRRPVARRSLGPALYAGPAGASPAAQALIDRGLYLLVAERTDQIGRDQRATERLMDYAEDNLVYRRVGLLQQPPDVIKLYRVTDVRARASP